MEVKRVQVLSHEGLHELPDEFIRPAHERPENSKAIEDGVDYTVPVISLSQPHDVVMDQISEACSEWGFFLLVDHDISPQLIQRLKEVGEEFFNLPQMEKESYANDPSSGSLYGYGTNITRNLGEKTEWVDYLFHVINPPPKVNYEYWPKNPPSYREVTDEYGVELQRVTYKLLELLSQGLGLEGKALRSCLGNEIEFKMKINLYPPCPQPQLALGVKPHTDAAALSLIVPNDVPGLQVCKDGNWVAVNYLPNALFVLVGDQVEVLSNGKYKSVLHRSLVHKEKTRISWAVFITPPYEATIGPIPDLTDGKNPAKYSTKTYAEYCHWKFNKNPK